MLKRLITWFLILTLLLTGISTVAGAETFDDTSAIGGVDVVIVMDNTRSMTEKTMSSSDVDNYRLDAASMLIGMMDMDTSRVAVLSFSAAPEMISDDLVSINDPDARAALVKNIYGLAGREENRTNIGSALMQALYILDSREDKTNDAMIVLLTDGKNDMVSGDSKYVDVSDVYRWKDGAIEKEASKLRITTDTANDLTKEAAECAAALGYPIYTIALNTSPDDVEAGGISLRDISRKTGLEDGCYQIAKGDASQLPEFFAKVLASKIGSSVQYAATPVLDSADAKKSEYSYSVTIPILNRSVLETNIIIPVGKNSGIDADTIRMYDAAGEIQSDSTGVTVLSAGDGHFAMLKIRSPKNTGMWKLKFVSKKTLEGKNISFNILYNYNIKLQGDLSVIGGETGKIYKTDTISLTASFVDPNGNVSQDSSLYADHTGEEGYEDWMTIRAHWMLYKVNQYESTLAAEGDLTGSTTQMNFASEIDLSRYNLSSGNYQLKVTADGAGLKREATFDLTLENHEPVAKNYTIPTLHVNTPGSGNEASYNTPVTGEILLTEMITDADSDALTYSVNGSSDCLTLALSQDGTKLVYSTVLSGDRQASGSVGYTVHYDDHDGGTGDVQVTASVVDDEAVALNIYEPLLLIDDAAYTAPVASLKNASHTITLRLKNKETGSFMDAETLQIQSRTLSVTRKDGTPAAENVSFTVDGDKLVYTLPTTGNTADELTVIASVGSFEPVEATISVLNNNAPAASPAAETFDVFCNVSGLPSFLQGMAGADTAEDSAALNLDAASFFSDADNDTLIFSAPVFCAEDGATPVGDEKITCAETGDNAWRFTAQHITTGIFHPTYQVRVSVTATDGDGLTATYVRTLNVTDSAAQLLTTILYVVIALAILTAIILIVHQIRKPVFPKLAVPVREEPSLFDNPDSSILKATKKPTTLNRIGLSPDIAAAHGISYKQAQNIIVFPIRSTTAVGVTVKELMKDHSIELDGVKLKARKKVTWGMGSSLTVANEKGTGSVELRLEQPVDESDNSGVMDDFGDGFSVVTGSTGKGGRGSKRSHKTQRVDKPTQTNDDMPSNDGFDF